MKKNILVTGSHRSGSTWTGVVISKAKRTWYVHEPFNIEIARKNSPFKYWFEHLNESPLNHQQKAKQYLNSFYYIFHKYNAIRFLNIRSLKEAYRFLVDLKGRITADRIVFKDPIAIMSAEWIYENYNWDIVVLIRHPAAFVASIKVKNWKYDFNNFLNQNILMEKYLKNYSEIIEDYAKNEKDIIDQGILRWNIFYDVIDFYKKKYRKEWYFVKHEDLSMNPIVEFEKLFSKINLKFDDNVKKYILESTKSEEKTKLKRNSVENIKKWKNILTEDEIQQIKVGTKNVWTKFYTEEDW